VRTAVDTNVILGLWSREPLASRVAADLGRGRAEGGLVVAAPVYAELLAHPSATPAFVDGFLAATNVVVDLALDDAIWREAAARFAAYCTRRRDSGGSGPKRPLADFVIGAHAALRADRLLTLDRDRYARDFPQLAFM
jgi:predicted nucleic acid-binding protein